MDFGDFVSACDKPMSEAANRCSLGLSPFRNSHVFYLGSDEKSAEAFDVVKADLVEYMNPVLRMPFIDVSIVEMCTGQWEKRKDQFPIEAQLPDGAIAPGWVCDRLIDVGHRYFPEFDKKLQTLLWMRVGEVNGKITDAVTRIMPYVCAYQGERTGVKAVVLGPDHALYREEAKMNGQIQAMLDTPALQQDALQNLANVAFEVAMISHPMNYIVKVTPQLDPSEQKRFKKFKKLPSYKRPHFIVVDHDVLVHMRKGTGTHASPTPHHRRGHWAQLAEHCRHALLLGKTKVWKRPTFVGDPQFFDAKNMYEVLLDFRPFMTGPDRN